MARSPPDAGCLLLRQADDQVGLSERVAGVLEDGRAAGKVRHTVEQLVRERLRADPALKMVCGECPVSGAPLAGQSTHSRLENSLRRGDLLHLGCELAQLVVEQLPADTVRVVVDIDASEDPCYGEQEGRSYNAYYGAYCYLPMYVHVYVHVQAQRADGEWDAQRLLTSVLREGVWPVRWWVCLMCWDAR